ncbi:chitinase [Streptomyces albus subsp. chlorinus]|uniref:chitinase n=1 Tax=Streptomyces albus TaxID=1888 RepID=UPI001570F47C|nr:chitinase [Streptomyces albus]NSC21496.1 chitinase [Streptomyces albus subsp. chlorinus]
MTGSRSWNRAPRRRAGRLVRVLVVPLLALAMAGTAFPGEAGEGRAAEVRERGAGRVWARPVVEPYLSLGWGDPPDPAALLRATGVDGFTFAFVLSAGGCEPRWDGERPLTGGVDERALRAVRVAGGEPVVSFGGGAGRKLEEDCPDAAALAGAYRKVIGAYGLNAIDVDIELDAYENGAVRRRTVEALKLVEAADPDLRLSVTLPSHPTGPDARLIDAAARAGLEPDVWTIMPFAFGTPPVDEAAARQARRRDMARAAVTAAAGLVRRLREAYGYDTATARAHSGVSTMNGITGHQEVITVEDFRTVAWYARASGLARLSFWSANRDRPCGTLPYPAEDRCSGVSQRPWEFTRALTSPGRRS